MRAVMRLIGHLGPGISPVAPICLQARRFPGRWECCVVCLRAPVCVMRLIGHLACVLGCVFLLGPGIPPVAPICLQAC